MTKTLSGSNLALGVSYIREHCIYTLEIGQTVVAVQILHGKSPNQSSPQAISAILRSKDFAAWTDQLSGIKPKPTPMLKLNYRRLIDLLVLVKAIRPQKADSIVHRIKRKARILVLARSSPGSKVE